MNQFLRFCAAGVIGFLIDAGILQALVIGMNANPYAARIGSFIAAASVTWLINRHYTFEVTQEPTHAEWLRYVCFMVLGSLVNYGAYVLCFLYWNVVPKHPWLGVATGSLAGLGVNFTTSRMLFLRKKSNATARR